MSLWVDKYRPKTLAQLDYHQSLSSHLKNLVQHGDFPHLLVHGPSGAGKKTRIMCLLREMFGSGVDKLRMERQEFLTPSNKKIELTTISSNYHIEINPSDVGIYDRIVIQELIKSVASSYQLDSSGQREFKVVLLTEVDLLTKDAQHALRRTMEKYVATCRLILCANSTSRVIPAVRSRCLSMRVAAPSNEEIHEILKNICRREGAKLPPELGERIIAKSDRNLRRAILLTEAAYVRQCPLEPDQEVPDLDWQTFIQGTAKMIASEQSPKQIAEVRNRLYELLIHGIPSELIFKGLLEELVKNCDMELKTKVIEAAARYEHRMHHGNKVIFHLEAFVAHFMSIYKKFMEDMMGDMF